MTFSVEIDDSHLRARFNAMPGKLQAALVRKTTVLRLQLEAKVKAAWPVKTGAGRRGVFSDQTATETSVEARVAESTDVFYGRWVEEGTSAHDIVPKSATALAFVEGGQQVFARRVHHPGTKPVGMFKNSLAAMAPQIAEGYRETVKEAQL